MIPTITVAILVTLLLHTVFGWALFEHRQAKLKKDNSSIADAVREAQEKARLMEAAIVGAKDAVIITAADISEQGPTILYVNEAFIKMTHYTAEEVIGKKCGLFYGPDTDKKTLKLMFETLKSGKPFSGELKNYTKTKSAFWADLSVVPVQNNEGIITHFASIQRDITQRKAFEKELTITKEAAQVANRAKSDFLANMSHELRTPMNAIIGLSELMLEMNLNEEQQELADAVNSSSRNLLILLNDILDLSKIEANELTLEAIPFDLRRAVRQTVELLKPMASRKSIVLESVISPIVPDRIIGDPTRLQQIMNNLVANAVKFTDVGYIRLDITSHKNRYDRPMLVIRVEDTGIGIPEEKQESIFAKFTQADVSTARKYGGTGLGLAITKELVEIMGGEISVESVEGKGTTFYIEIPIEIATMQNAGDGLTENLEKNIPIGLDTAARILVVDDHPVNLLFMRKVLKKLGFEHVDEARSGKESVAFAEKQKYDLIFMDCQMPELDGFEASAIIREMEDFENQIKIIAVTADAMKGARERCIDAGMNDYVSKPVDIEKLRSVLSEWLPGSGEKTAAILESLSAATPASASLIMDWDRLRMFTDGNREEEESLIQMFNIYAEESLQILSFSLKDDQADEWRKAAHKMKGSAANLGATALSEACFLAEQNYQADEIRKNLILDDIMKAYKMVCRELDAEIHGTQAA
jgi:PAS domain S-box-containing protein